MRIEKIYSRTRFRIRDFVSTKPYLFWFLVKVGLIGGYKKISTKNCNIVIEGFPRSGNSFALSAFAYAHPDCDNIATHLHVAANVMLGVKYGVPVMLMLRSPVDAVKSLISLEYEVLEGRVEVIEEAE